MRPVPLKKSSAAEHQTCRALYERQSLLGEQQLGDQQLMPQPAEGLEHGASSYSLLAERKFPVRNFIGDPKDLNYTPAYRPLP